MYLLESAKTAKYPRRPQGWNYWNLPYHPLNPNNSGSSGKLRRRHVNSTVALPRLWYSQHWYYCGTQSQNCGGLWYGKTWHWGLCWICHTLEILLTNNRRTVSLNVITENVVLDQNTWHHFLIDLVVCLTVYCIFRRNWMLLASGSLSFQKEQFFKRHMPNLI